MLVTCLRHATAEPHSLIGGDAERQLDKKGINQMRRVAEFCRKNALIPGALFCSPLQRARQTATLLQGQLPDCPPPQVVEWLNIPASPQGIVAELAKLEALGCADVWLVGHEPDLSALIAYFIQAPRDSVVIKKASLTRIEIDVSNPTASQLLWSIPCALMR